MYNPKLKKAKANYSLVLFVLHVERNLEFPQETNHFWKSIDLQLFLHSILSKNQNTAVRELKGDYGTTLQMPHKIMRLKHILH